MSAVNSNGRGILSVMEEIMSRSSRSRTILQRFLTALLVLTPSFAAAQSILYSVDVNSNLLRTFDPANGATLSSVAILLPGATVTRSNGLASHPTTGELFALVGAVGDRACTSAGGGQQRRLVKVNPVTGAATNVGQTGDCFAGLAFHTNGTLYGVTGDGAATPSALFTIDTTTAHPTFLKTLPGTMDSGEALGFNASDGLLYRVSGSSDQVFQSIDPSTMAVTNIQTSGFAFGEMTALTHFSGNVLLGVASGQFLTLTTSGVSTFVSDLNYFPKGFAFVSNPLVAAVLPSSRSTTVGTAATAFATIVNAGQTLATACGISLLSNIKVTFSYQTTDQATNLPIGTPNTAVNIPANGFQAYVFSLTPTEPVAPVDVRFTFDCSNTAAAAITTGVNTLQFFASASPITDIVMLSATPPPDPGIVNIPGDTGTGFFSVATVNVGASGSITLSANTGGVVLPVNLFICQTNPPTGACLGSLAPSVTVTIDSNDTPTFAGFAQGTGNIPFDPALNRIRVEGRDGTGNVVGGTTVAIRT